MIYVLILLYIIVVLFNIANLATGLCSHDKKYDNFLACISLIPILQIYAMLVIVDFVKIGSEVKEKLEMNSGKIVTVCRKLLKIYYVENIPCYVVDGKIHQLPKLEREEAKLYLVSESDDRNKVSRVEITYEE